MFTTNQLFLVVHIAVGVGFLHFFAGGLSTFLTVRDSRVARAIQTSSLIGMATLAWVTVISGTWLVYPSYRATPPAGANLAAYPKEWLTSSDATAWWHTFGMEWKEHVGWLAPFLATAVAVTVLRHRDLVRRDRRARRVLGMLFVTAFAATVVAAGLGAAINKVSPNDFLLAGWHADQAAPVTSRSVP
jgi:hypothetical protein